MATKRTLMGDAPRLVLIVGPALLAAILATVLFPGFGSFTLRFRGLFVIAAILLSALGIVFWASAAYELVRAWRRKTIAVRGAYGLCRHPIFAAWIWFVLPVVAFLTDSWYFLAAAIVFLVASIIAAPHEESQMREEFGDAYDEYRRRTRMLVPIARIVPFTGIRFLKGALGLLAFVAVAIALVAWIAVPAGGRLGANRAELSMTIPGDELAPAPNILYTQAITINAPADQIWPWLVQVGYRRAGWYNIDAINRIAGPDYFVDGTGSSVRIHPELQTLDVGDQIGLVPVLYFDVVAMERGRYFVISKGPDAGTARTDPSYMNVVWTFLVEPIDSDHTRLITRYRTEFNGGFGKNFFSYVFNDLGGALLQQPAMLYGVKMRAEGRTQRMS